MDKAGSKDASGAGIVEEEISFGGDRNDSLGRAVAHRPEQVGATAHW